MYKIIIAVVKGDYKITARFESTADNMQRALEKATKYAFMLMDDESADYISEVNVWKMDE